MKQAMRIQSRAGRRGLRQTLALTGAGLLTLGAAAPAAGWDAAGHRMITRLALESLTPAEAGGPGAWLRQPRVIDAVSWQAAEPDRWRGVRSAQVQHAMNPDHYLDVEDLEHYGLTLESIPPLRYRYLVAMAISRHEHPEGLGGPNTAPGSLPPPNPKLDPSGQQEWPGFVPYASAETWARLVSAIKTLRVLEALDEPARAAQVEMARANVMVQLGILSHWIGDTAQPLHTTRHFNGWVGDNPRGFTTEKTFHAYVDGGVLKHHGITFATLRTAAGEAGPAKPPVDETDPWPALIGQIRRSFDQMVPLYELHKSGALQQEEGEAFIVARLNDAAGTLAALVDAAWRAGTPSEKDRADFLKYDGFDPAERAEGAEGGEGGGGGGGVRRE